MKKLDLKETFEYIHNILKCSNYNYGDIHDGGIRSQDNEKVCKYYYYYDQDGDHTCTLILLKDKIEFVHCLGQTDCYAVLDTNSKNNYLCDLLK